MTVDGIIVLIGEVNHVRIFKENMLKMSMNHEFRNRVNYRSRSTALQVLFEKRLEFFNTVLGNNFERSRVENVIFLKKLHIYYATLLREKVTESFEK